jgi:hypothetical protein
MNININPSIKPAFAPASAPAPSKVSKPGPQPAPAPVQDNADVDFSNIDTPEKALQLPIMDPAYQLGLALGAVATAFGGAFGMPLGAMVGGEFSSNGETVSQTLTTIDKDLNISTFSVMGDGIETEPQITLGLDEQAMTYKNNFGGTKVDLTWTLNQEDESLMMTGRIGDVEADLRYTGDADEESGLMHIEGTLGGKEYVLDTSISEMPEMGEDAFKMKAEGHLGGQAISKTYQAVTESSEEEMYAMIELSGQGEVAGYQQTIELMAGVGPDQ